MPHRALAAALALASLLPAAALAERTCTAYGKGVTLPTATAAAEILAAPDRWSGKEVRVDGRVQDVCEMAGCWVEIVAAGSGDAAPTVPALKVKVKDGEIVFPVAARGADARAQGVVEVQELTREKYVGWQRHLAEEQGKPFDEASIGDGPYRIVQVQGTGAEICR